MSSTNHMPCAIHGLLQPQVGQSPDKAQSPLLVTKSEPNKPSTLNLEPLNTKRLHPRTQIPKPQIKAKQAKDLVETLKSLEEARP